jgi:hypothetical protein
MPRFGRALGQAERRPGSLLGLGDQRSAEGTGAGDTTWFGRQCRGLDAARRDEKLTGAELDIAVRRRPGRTPQLSKWAVPAELVLDPYDPGIVTN